MPEKVIPAENEVCQNEARGERPYELVWAARKRQRKPSVDFNDLSGWRVALCGGAEATFVRSREQLVWEDHVAKIVYRGAAKESRVILCPPEPVAVSGRCVHLWCYGNKFDWRNDASTPRTHLAIYLQDARPEAQSRPLTRRVCLGYVRWREWWLVHVFTDQTPWRFLGLEVGELNHSEDRVLYFDSLEFYEEELKPLRFEPRPARNIKPFPGQTHGLNGTGKGSLPFPTREETILPENRERDFNNSIRQVSKEVFELRYSGKDGQITFQYRPQSGDLGEIAGIVNGQQVIRPLYGGGLEFGSDRASVELESVTHQDDHITVDFVCRISGTHHGMRYELRVWQKSLILDVVCRGGVAHALSLGECAEVDAPKLVQIPYLTFRSSNPRVLMFGPAGETLFASVWVDWYRSSGSELYSQERVGEQTARINGGVRYHPKTDGARNDVYERVFVTVSPVFEETLPTIANPATVWGKKAGSRLWQESWGPQDLAKEHERSQMLRSYGIEQLIQCNHEKTWRDGYESFTLRTKAAPGKGGDAALQKYVTSQKSLGWRSGLYTNYCDSAPVNEYWDEDGVQRTSENQWRPGWPRCYALKPARAVEWNARLAPLIRQKYDSDSAYTDVHTAVEPWRYCDYDARVPGAGTFAATYYAYGEILLNDQRTYCGPIFSEGTYQWLYAGLASGNYGLAYTDLDLCEYPLQVAFDLLKIHPLECDIGMPWTAAFLEGRKASLDTPERIDAGIDRFIAGTLAYGHIGWLVEESYGIRRTCRSYYLIQQTAKRYALQRPTTIEYADSDGSWLSVSQALASGAIQDSRLHVVYENGLELYVNWDEERTWRLPIGLPEWAEISLPPNGFVAFAPDGFRAASAIWQAHRVDQVLSDEYAYLDGRGQQARNAALASEGAVAMLLSKNAGQIIEQRLIDIEGNQRIGFRCEMVHPQCRAHDAAGCETSDVGLERGQDEKLWFEVVEGARYYVVRG